jgi:superoxide reductase
MPRVFRAGDIDSLENDLQKDYFDRHTPNVICDSTARKGEKLKVKVKMGKEYKHPNEPDHFISTIQLWNRETLLAEVHFSPGTPGNAPEHAEVDFYIVPKTSMNLSAMAICTKHGLWQSEPAEVKVTD